MYIYRHAGEAIRVRIFLLGHRHLSEQHVFKSRSHSWPRQESVLHKAGERENRLICRHFSIWIIETLTSYVDAGHGGVEFSFTLSGTCTSISTRHCSEHYRLINIWVVQYHLRQLLPGVTSLDTNRGVGMLFATGST